MLSEVCAALPVEQIRDFSIGSFRISQDYLKKMRRAMPRSSVVQFPFVNENGYYSYGKELSERMEAFVMNELAKVVPRERIFRWREK